MAKFSIYSYLFEDLTISDQENDGLFEGTGELEPVMEQGNWEKRCEILDDILQNKETPVEYKEGDTVHPHKQIICQQNRSVAIMRFANVKEIQIEENFKHKKVNHYPSCLVFIDNREGLRHIAVQRSRDSFYSTDMVVRILEDTINKNLRRKGLKINIHAQRYPTEVWKVMRMHEGRISNAIFSTTTEAISSDNYEGTDKELSNTDFLLELEEAAREMNGDPCLEFKAKKGSVLKLREDSTFVQSMVNSCAAAGLPVILKTVDGLCFECFVSEGPEEERKILSQDMEDYKLKELDDTDLFGTSTQHVIEFLNSIKNIDTEDGEND